MMRLLGIGNALVDIMTELDHDDYLREFGLPKGSMVLVDAQKSKHVFDGTQHLNKTIRSGGSAANTVHGIARMGIEAGFIGKVGRDEMGKIFSDDLIDSHVKPHLFHSSTASGRSMALISPDAERTFATYLGAAIELSADDMDEKLFSEYDILHVEGYLVQNQALLRKALELAKKKHLLISIDLASYNVVEANREFLQTMVSEFVDIVFANEEEARVFTGEEPERAVEAIASHCKVAVVKTGRSGSLVREGGQTHTVGIIPANSIDTTGAGDLYASGFLYGLAHGMPVDRCGHIGAILAGKVIEVIGPKMDNRGWNEVKRMVGKV